LLEISTISQIQDVGGTVFYSNMIIGGEVRSQNGEGKENSLS